MLRTLSGLAAGLAVAMVTVIIVETIGHQLFPPPRGFDMTRASAEALPFATLVWPVLAWFLGSLAGSALAVHLSRRGWTGWAVAALVLAGTIFNFSMIPHPMGVMVAGGIAPIFGGWIGQRVAARTRGPSTD